MISSRRLCSWGCIVILWMATGNLSGCGSDFEPRSKITGFRILSVQASPSWLALSLANENRFPTTILSTLTVGATNPDALEYRWRWCPLLGSNSLAFECLISSEELVSGTNIDGISTDLYELGSESTVSFPNTSITPAFVEELCLTIRSQPEISSQVTLPECNGTFPISIRVDITDGEQIATAFKDVQLIYDEELLGTENINRDPSLDGWEIRLLRQGLPIEDSLIELDETLTLQLRKQASTNEDEAPNNTLDEFSQFYTDTCEEPLDDGTVIERDVTTRERVTLSWFITAGSIQDERTGYVPGPICDPGIIDSNDQGVIQEWEEAKINRWDSPRFRDELVETSSVTIYVIARDNRGGASYTSTTVQVREVINGSAD
ncbi:MAG: hypothetical protein KTR25_16750 [Myxococcales bacterium]|nr:hypothetical protein [Myxococcales bacterium]